MNVSGIVNSPIPHTHGIPVPTLPVPIRPVERRNTSPFQRVEWPADDAARFKAEAEAARILAEADKRKRGGKPQPKPKRRGTPRTRAPKFDIARAAELYEAGWSCERIGKAMGVSKATMLKHLKRAGVQMREATSYGLRVAPADILALAPTMNAVQIAEHFGISSVTVYKRLKDANVRAVPMPRGGAAHKPKEGAA